MQVLGCQKAQSKGREGKKRRERSQRKGGMQTLGSVNTMCSVFEDSVCWRRRRIILLCTRCVSSPGLDLEYIVQSTWRRWQPSYLPGSFMENYFVGGKPLCKIKAILGRGELCYTWNLLPQGLCKASAEEAICIPLSIIYALKSLCFGVLVIISWFNREEFYWSRAVNEICLVFHSNVLF